MTNTDILSRKSTGIWNCRVGDKAGYPDNWEPLLWDGVRLFRFGSERTFLPDEVETIGHQLVSYYVEPALDAA